MYYQHWGCITTLSGLQKQDGRTTVADQLSRTKDQIQIQLAK